MMRNQAKNPPGWNQSLLAGKCLQVAEALGTDVSPEMANCLTGPGWGVGWGGVSEAQSRKKREQNLEVSGRHLLPKRLTSAFRSERTVSARNFFRWGR